MRHFFWDSTSALPEDPRQEGPYSCFWFNNNRTCTDDATHREYHERVRDDADLSRAFVPLNNKIHALREIGLVTALIAKCNKAPLPDGCKRGGRNLWPVNDLGVYPAVSQSFFFSCG